VLNNSNLRRMFKSKFNQIKSRNQGSGFELPLGNTGELEIVGLYKSPLVMKYLTQDTPYFFTAEHQLRYYTDAYVTRDINRVNADPRLTEEEKELLLEYISIKTDI